MRVALLIPLGAAALFAQPFRVIDMDRHQPAEIALPGGKTVRLELLEREEAADTVRGAVRLARVRVKWITPNCGSNAGLIACP